MTVVTKINNEQRNTLDDLQTWKCHVGSLPRVSNEKRHFYPQRFLEIRERNVGRYTFGDGLSVRRKQQYNDNNACLFCNNEKVRGESTHYLRTKDNN